MHARTQCSNNFLPQPIRRKGIDSALGVSVKTTPRNSPLKTGRHSNRPRTGASAPFPEPQFPRTRVYQTNLIPFSDTPSTGMSLTFPSGVGLLACQGEQEFPRRECLADLGQPCRPLPFTRLRGLRWLSGRTPGNPLPLNGFVRIDLFLLFLGFLRVFLCASATPRPGSASCSYLPQNGYALPCHSVAAGPGMVVIRLHKLSRGR